MAFYDHHAAQQQQHQQQLQQHHQQPSIGGDLRTSLWMGELEPWMDENWLRSVWYSFGEQVTIKMIRDKYTGASAGYCFVELTSSAAAAKALAALNGMPIPNTNKAFKLNWASGGSMVSMPSGAAGGPEYSVFVGDLSPDVTEFVLMATFQDRFMTCRSAKIMTDPATGLSRGYGFVRFGDESEQLRALQEMHGVYCGSRPMRISMATPKSKQMSGTGMNNGLGGGNIGGNGLGGMNNGSLGGMNNIPGPVGGMGGVNVNNMTVGSGPGHFGFAMPPQPNQNSQHAMNQFNDPNNTTVFVGGLSGVNHEDDLRNYFQPFGEITYVKIPPGKGCGFVQFVHRQSAEMAITQMNGYQIGNSRVRLSWGRAQSDNKPMSPQGSMVGVSNFRGPLPGGHQFQMQPPARPAGPAGPYPGYSGMMTTSAPMVGFMPSQSLRDPLERVPAETQNRAFITRKEAIMERMDEGSSWRAIYAA